MTVNPGYKNVESFAGGITCYMMETKDVISSISSKLKTENFELVSFNGQSIIFRLSLEQISFCLMNAEDNDKNEVTL